MIPPLPPASQLHPATHRERLDQAADAFEAVFLRQMLASMRAATFGESLFDSGATEQYRTMLDSSLADSMASGSRLGIAEALTARLGAPSR